MRFDRKRNDNVLYKEICLHDFIRNTVNGFPSRGNIFYNLLIITYIL